MTTNLSASSPLAFLVATTVSIRAPMTERHSLSTAIFSSRGRVSVSFLSCFWEQQNRGVGMAGSARPLYIGLDLREMRKNGTYQCCLDRSEFLLGRGLVHR